MNLAIYSYSDELARLINDIANDLIEGIGGGIAYKIATHLEGEIKLYNVIINEGYQFNYKEFLQFKKDYNIRSCSGKEMVDKIRIEEEKRELGLICIINDRAEWLNGC